MAVGGGGAGCSGNLVKQRFGRQLPLIHLGALFVFGSTFRFLEHFSVLAENCRQWNKPECKVTLPIVQSSVPNWVSDHNPVTPSPKPSPQEEEAEGVVI